MIVYQLITIRLPLWKNLARHVELTLVPLFNAGYPWWHPIYEEELKDVGVKVLRVDGNPELKLTRGLRLNVFLPYLLAKSSFDVLIMYDYTNVNSLISTVWSKIKHIPSVLWVINHQRALTIPWLIAEKLYSKHLAERIDFFLPAFGRVYELLASLGVPQHRMRIVHETGVDADEMAKKSDGETFMRRYRIPDNEDIILFVGELVPKKGPDILIKAFKIVSDEVKDVHLVIVGDGWLREGLKEIVQREGLQGKVTFTGWIGHGRGNNIPSALDCSNLVVMPYRNEMQLYSFFRGLGYKVKPGWLIEDQLPFIVVEAGAMGKPVIAGDVGGVPEEVVDGETGYVLHNINAETCAGKIIEVLQDKKLLRSLGCAARRYVEEQFSYRHISSQLIATLDKLV